MYIFFEASGSYKTGTILATQNESWQIELLGGKHIKVKQRDGLFQFDHPNAATLWQKAHTLAQSIDIPFLWECASDGTLDFKQLAIDYYGAQPNAIEQAALLLSLAQAPIYFRRKGKGHYQRVAPAQVEQALAALARKQQQAQQQIAYEAELKTFHLPEPLAKKLPGLLFHPDKNSIEWKALENASAALSLSPEAVLLRCGVWENAYALHKARFLAEYFPKGVDFPQIYPKDFGLLRPEIEYENNEDNTNKIQKAKDIEYISFIKTAAKAQVRAFSIDDASTTEIDDAFSVEILENQRIRAGIHIAAPALGIAPNDPIDQIAAQRISTVYMPGEKITMLPKEIIDLYTLSEKNWHNVLSLYLIVDAHYQIITTETRIEQIWIERNLDSSQLEQQVTEILLERENLDRQEADFPYQKELSLLWPLAQKLNEQRQETRKSYGLKAEMTLHPEYRFEFKGDQVIITTRQRNTPIDKIIAELAIFANSHWGQLLAESGVAGIYRTQRSYGVQRTRMQTTPAAHEGLGVAQYAWSTSPLRRYVDLINQWQLLACVKYGVTAPLAAPFQTNSSQLLMHIAHFESVYGAYIEFQTRIERYWCLRWLQQENKQQISAHVLKPGLVRLCEIPLLAQTALPNTLQKGDLVLLDILSINEISLTLSCRLAQILSSSSLAAVTAPDQEENPTSMPTLASQDTDRTME